MTLTIYHWKFTNKAVLFFFTELFVIITFWSVCIWFLRLCYNTSAM